MGREYMQDSARMRNLPHAASPPTYHTAPSLAKTMQLPPPPTTMHAHPHLPPCTITPHSHHAPSPPTPTYHFLGRCLHRQEKLHSRTCGVKPGTWTHAKRYLLCAKVGARARVLACVCVCSSGWLSAMHCNKINKEFSLELCHN